MYVNINQIFVKKYVYIYIYIYMYWTHSPSESQRRWFSFRNCETCFGADPPAPVSKSPPPCTQIECILGEPVIVCVCRVKD